MDFELTEDQQKTLDMVTDFIVHDENEFMIIQGSAGTGKSTLIKPITELVYKLQKMKNVLLQKQNNTDPDFEVALTATTNPAVAVLEELTGMRASTIYSLLELKVVDNFRTGATEISLIKNAQPVRNMYIIVDEASMMTPDLFNYIQSQTINCKIILIGDWYQLAPVGYQIVPMKQLSEETEYPTAIMNKIMRNAGAIMETGQQFRETVETGTFKPVPRGKPEIMHVDGPTFRTLVDEAFTSNEYNSKSDKILAYRNATVLAYCSHIREVQGKPENLLIDEVVITNKPIIGSGYGFSVDSEVVITNISEAFEDEEYGITGHMVELNQKIRGFLPSDQNEVRALLKRLANAAKCGEGQWSAYFGVKNTWFDLRLPYASTVHKAQGSSYNRVYIDLNDIGYCRQSSDVARMLYVAFSRAREKVYVYGQLPKKYGG